MTQQHNIFVALVALVLVMNLLGLSFTIHRNMRDRRRSSENAKNRRILEHAPY
jgi:hypothetical protein